MARGVSLKKFTLTEVDYLYVGAFRLRVVAHSPRGGMDPAVFLYQRGVADPTTGEAIDRVISIASPADMADYPVGAPDPADPYPFFRLDWYEVDVRASSIAAELWATTIREVGTLCTALDRMEQLVPVESAECGASPVAGGSSASLSYRGPYYPESDEVSGPAR